MKRILFLTGTRADFGKLKPLIKAVQGSEFEYGIFATGMHMQAVYGATHLEIAKSGFEYYPFMNHEGSMDAVLANTVHGLGRYVRENRPDLLVVHGDRVEALAGAIVGALNNILVAHIEGGELSGTVDELVRHAVSKLSHIHFVSNDEARTRLEQMGETNILVIGSPDIDVMLGDLPPLDEVREYYEIPFSDYAICIYHPVTTEPLDLSVFDAIERSGKKYVVIYPNNDTGAERIIERIDKLVAHCRILPSMRFEYFLTLLKNAQFIIGNSSAGIREAPVYGVPTINVGTRQNGRHAAPSIVNIGYGWLEILDAINNLPPRVQSMHFGKGDSAERFMECLRNDAFWDTPTQKEFKDYAQSLVQTLQAH